jgi:hypothetical protein
MTEAVITGLQVIDLAVPDVPERDMPGAYRLRNLPELVDTAQLLLTAAGAPLTQYQRNCLVTILDGMIFGEQG